MTPLSAYPSAGIPGGGFTYHMREPNGRMYDISPLPQMGLTQVKSGGKKARYSLEQVQEIVKLYNEGVSTLQLCKKFKCGSKSMAELLLQNRVVMRKPGRRSNHMKS